MAEKRPRGRPRSSRADAPVSAPSSGAGAQLPGVETVTAPLCSLPGPTSGTAEPAPSGLGESLPLPLEATPSSGMPVVSFSLPPDPSPSAAPAQTVAPLLSVSTAYGESDRTALTSVCDDLGAGVPQNIREKIWNGEFVEFGVLVRPARSGTHMGDCVFTIGTPESPAWQIRPRNQAPRITSIEQWTSAFFIFASIYLIRHPTRARELLKYADIVRSAAFRRTGYGWRDYDIQFRLRQARMPSRSWASIDAELWLTLLAAPIQQPNFRSFASVGQTTTGPSRPFQRSPTNGICFDFNRGHCFRAACRFIHKCTICQSAGHPATNCRTRARPAQGSAGTSTSTSHSGKTA